MRGSYAGRIAFALSLTAAVPWGCGPGADREGVVISFSGSSVGAEGAALRASLARFMVAHPGVRVVERPTPDAADQRHQLYVQWLGTGTGEPDVIQIDVIWTAELAAAGFIRPLGGAVDTEGFFPRTLEANRWQGRLYALPWFVDAGMLYYRTDLHPRPPGSLDELIARAGAAERAGVTWGYVWPGARYEGLVTVFVEHLGAFGGRILDEHGAVALDSPAALRALRTMKQEIDSGVVPRAALAWQEEQVRHAFASGRAAFMRNWPYAAPLLADPGSSSVAGRFAVTGLPGTPAGAPTATLGGAGLAVNAHSRHPSEAMALVAFLGSRAEMLERARRAGEYPPRRDLYEGDALAGALPIPPREARRILEHAVPRPVTPVYTQLSEILQIHLHRALTGQETPERALSRATGELRALPGIGRNGDSITPSARPDPLKWILAAIALGAALLAAAWRAWTQRSDRSPRRGAPGRDARLAVLLVLPALAWIAVIALFPLGYSVWESLHRHDLRFPSSGRPFVGLANYAEALGSPRFLHALAHTAFFTVVTVGLELVFGFALALAVGRAFAGRGAVRASVLLPWALPTVVAALVFRFLFDAPSGVVNAALLRGGLIERPIVWLVGAFSAWVPIILADVWKTTPFVALLLLAGMQTIDPTLYEAATLDGAGPVARFVRITLPLTRSSILVAVMFRTLDAVRVFDLVYVLTGGGPGTATEPIGLYTFSTLIQSLRFGYGSALAILIFVLTALIAIVYLRTFGRDTLEEAAP